jgi:hypothetical protein
MVRNSASSTCASGTEWAETSSVELKRVGASASGEDYYRHGLSALERIVTVKHLTDDSSLSRYRAAWEHAAGRTPHGQPIEVRATDFLR